MRLHRIALGFTVVLLFGCDRSTPLAPEITADMQPELC